MESTGSVTRLIQDMRDAESSTIIEAAAAEIWRRYFERLAEFARRKLNAELIRDSDAEDAAISAFTSFCSGIRANKFDELQSRHSLWSLLAVITTRKIADYGRRSATKKRGGLRVSSEEGLGDKRSINEIVGGAPDPAFEAASREMLNRLLDLLCEPALQETAVMRLHGWQTKEIAQHRKCGLRTVERQLNAIRLKWSEELSTDG